MSDANPPVFDLRNTYVELSDAADATPVEGGSAFWSRIGERKGPDAGRLICVTRQAADWKTWEMHPAGDEILYLLSGAVCVILEEGQTQRSVQMGEQTALLVSRGVWHRITVQDPGEMLFITRGAGTQHRPV